MSDVYLDKTRWATLHDQRHSPPPKAGEPLKDWVHAQHIPSPYESTIRTAVEDLLASHRGTTQQSLAITGEGDSGKTAAITSIVFADLFESGEVTWLRSDRHTHRVQHPWVYVNCSTGTPEAILRQISDFCRFPPARNADATRQALRTLLPLHGVKAIVVDDAQVLRRSSAASTKITDGLRGVMHLPVPVIWVGVDLHVSALLKDFGRRDDSVNQIRRRTHVVSIQPLNGVRASQFRDLVAAFAQRLQLIDGFTMPGLDEPGMLKTLAVASNAYPGSLFEVLKKASCAALDHDRTLTGDLLKQALPGRELTA